MACEWQNYHSQLHNCIRNCIKIKKKVVFSAFCPDFARFCPRFSLFSTIFMQLRSKQINIMSNRKYAHTHEKENAATYLRQLHRGMNLKN